MSKPISRVATPAALFYLFVIAAQMIGGFYLAREQEPPQAFSLLYALGFVWVMGWWLLNDSRARGVGWVLDMGLFLYIAWPLIMPYYLIKTRGWKGLLVILIFLGVYVGAALAGAALYDLLGP
jgi:hypothetical protein